uniref:GCN5-like N-acetyltransferase n=1 Tax=uncultured bacterium Contigcl_24 TaxID=1393668 RepID=W0FL25_9BACT|nr:GCN5-like N-acetyltransferase [uncultured bacterium Contigcl_24]
MTREDRIAVYEDILDRASHAADAMEAALEEYSQVLPDLQKLEKYYVSSDWKEDYAADEAGLVPKNLKRGVLSQDAVCNLLDRYRELAQILRQSC